ncbi:hypothetical protein [Fodinicola feengrottensis]|uniref:Uncharacterized protein n=1 Tax=Fodinicola feengrottensis TaxID=435914 RepID=A0ABP4RLB7_9ACTN|nr:hypothetical protein [Fodinicola feengrottensis]
MTTLDVRPTTAPIVVPAERLHRRALLITVAMVSALVPWCVVLSQLLPSTTTVAHWSVAWVGLDSGEALAAALTAILILRKDPRAALTAVIGGALLLADAWFDLTTATSGGDLLQAGLEAALLEVPLAIAAFWYASTALTRP